MKVLGKVVAGYIVFCAVAAASAIVVRRRIPDFGEEGDDEFSVVAAMGGRLFHSTSEALTDAAAVACMGGIELDLTDATITEGATLKLSAIMGGIDVTVPQAWRVEVASTSIMGGVGNATDPDAPGDGPLLIVSATTVMGGILIREGTVESLEVA